MFKKCKNEKNLIDVKIYTIDAYACESCEIFDCGCRIYYYYDSIQGEGHTHMVDCSNCKYKPLDWTKLSENELAIRLGALAYQINKYRKDE